MSMTHSSGNPYLGDAVQLARYRKAREEWERRGRRGPPPVPPGDRTASNPRRSPTAYDDGRAWARKVYAEKLAKRDLPQLGFGFTDELRAARAVQAIAQRKLHASPSRAGRHPVAAKLPAAQRTFWQGVLDQANDLAVQHSVPVANPIDPDKEARVRASYERTHAQAHEYGARTGMRVAIGRAARRDLFERSGLPTTADPRVLGLDLGAVFGPLPAVFHDPEGPVVWGPDPDESMEAWRESQVTHQVAQQSLLPEQYAYYRRLRSGTTPTDGVHRSLGHDEAMAIAAARKDNPAAKKPLRHGLGYVLGKDGQPRLFTKKSAKAYGDREAKQTRPPGFWHASIGETDEYFRLNLGGDPRRGWETRKNPIAQADWGDAQKALKRFRHALQGVFPRDVRWSVRVHTSDTDRLLGVPSGASPLPEGTLMVVVTLEACPEAGHYDRFYGAVLEAFQASGLSGYLYFDGTEYGGSYDGDGCPARSYHFYDPKPGQPAGIDDSDARQAASAVEAALIEQTFGKKTKNPARLTSSEEGALESLAAVLYEDADGTRVFYAGDGDGFYEAAETLQRKKLASIVDSGGRGRKAWREARIADAGLRRFQGNPRTELLAW